MAKIDKICYNKLCRMKKFMYPTIVSTEWLGDHVQKSAVRLFDCTLYSGISAAEASERFSKAHIPTAAQFRVQLDIDVDLDEYTIIPKPNIFAKYVTMAGLSRGLHCVLYDTDGKSAYRIWWLLNFFSHPKVSIYPGGLKEWIEKGMPIDSKRKVQQISVPKTAFSSHPRFEMIVKPSDIRRFVLQNISDKTDVVSTLYPRFFTMIEEIDMALDSKSFVSRLEIGDTSSSSSPTENTVRQLVDVRAIRRDEHSCQIDCNYVDQDESGGPCSTSTSGEGSLHEKDLQALHHTPQTQQARLESIPFSLIMPYTSFLDESGVIVGSSAVLRSKFRSAGIDITKPVTFYGDSGYETSVAVLAAVLASGQSPSIYSILKDPLLRFWSVYGGSLNTAHSDDK
ncbi:Thiosulfate sulfurtransferase [Giardia duodenalis]|uniref:Thiosulfate sulfurtransferase n=1 Tax=Giardia intestinalis TaxID=5741 RepID=V6THT2_GIAIN|nr:Thiosulfate sulfurtransferase [Giardia intestinalis]